MRRAYDTAAAARRAGASESRMREQVRNRYVSPERLGNGMMAWSGDIAIAIYVMAALDAGVAYYAVRMLAERLAPLKSADEIADYASRVALYEDRGLWRIADGNLDGRALEMAKIAKRRGARVVTFNKEN